jgi:AcrR family transcriptional regulator
VDKHQETGMDAPAAIAQRPKRADGRRNYDAILATARRAFAEHGANASLEDIAARAGVAIGTLYRHFPSRESMVEAATRDGLAELIAHAQKAATAEDPRAALIDWMHDAIRHFSTFRGLVGILNQSMYDQGTPSHSMCITMHDSGADLLQRAQRPGLIRADLTPDELFDLLYGLAWLRENTPPGKDNTARILELITDGIAD